VVLERYGFEPGRVYMAVPRCDGCKWWAREQPGYNLGECTFGGSGRCFVEAVRGGPVKLQTREDFGCVQFQAKDVPPAA